MKPSKLRTSFDNNINSNNVGGNWTPRSSNDWANKTLSPPPPPPPAVRSSINTNKALPSPSSSLSFKNTNNKPISNSSSSNDNKKQVVKRPFLKKGSRKEPSAIHRVRRDESSSPVTTTSSTNDASTTTTTTTTTNSRHQVSRNKIASSSFKANQDFEHEVVVKGDNYYRTNSNPSPINTMSYTNTYSKNHMETLTYDDNNTSILNEAISIQLRLKQTTALQELDEFAMLEKELENMNDAPLQPFYDNNKKNINQSTTNDDGDNNNNDNEHYSNNDQ